MTAIKWRDQVRSVIANKLLQIVITILPRTTAGHELALLEAIQDYAECDAAFALEQCKSDRLRKLVERSLAERVDHAKRKRR